MKVKMYTDGGARGNPGPAGIGVYICDLNGKVLLAYGEAIGFGTNNIAEYQALITGLKKAHALGATEMTCFLDSELVVRQLNGQYKVKNPNMRQLFNEVQVAAGKFKHITYTHLRREEDHMPEADRLVNEALDH